MVRTSSVAVATAGTAGPVVVNRKADLAQRTGAFDHVTDRRFRLTAQRLLQRRERYLSPLYRVLIRTE
jgi:hypothetical protein